MLSGRTPFQANTPAELVLQIIEGPSSTVGSFNPTVPAGVQAIVEKMMCVDPNNRFQSAEDLLHALGDVNLNQNLEKGTTALARRLARELRQKIQVP